MKQKTYTKWSKAKTNLLLKMYNKGVSVVKIAKFFKVNPQAISSKIYYINHPELVGNHKRKYRTETQGYQNIRHWEEWEDEEIAILLKMREVGKSYKDMHKILGRSAQACENKIARLEGRRDD